MKTLNQINPVKRMLCVALMAALIGGCWILGATDKSYATVVSSAVKSIEASMEEIVSNDDTVIIIPAPAGKYENVSNDTKGQALKLYDNRGLDKISAKDDIDWFYFNLGDSGHFKIEFDVYSPEDVALTNGYQIEVYTSNNTLIDKRVNIKESIELVYYYDKNDNYYIKVSSPYNTPALQLKYEVEPVKYVDSEYDENEKNNSFSTANFINKKCDIYDYEVTGSLLNATDKDYSKFELKKPSNVTFVFWETTKYSNQVKSGQTIEIYNSSKKLIKKINFNGSNTKLSKTTFNLDKGTYYICVKYSNSIEAMKTNSYEYHWELTVNSVISNLKTTVKSLSAGSKQAIIKWNKNPKVTGYYIYRSTSKNGTYSKVATISKNSTTSYTNKKLTKGKTYYYKMKCYTKTLNGITVTGPWSNVKSVKITK